MTQLAQIILEQLGGKGFVTMTGARGLMPTNNGLCFLLPRDPEFVKDDIAFVRITLNGNDLYDVEYHRFEDEKLALVHFDEDIFCDMLQETFTRRTGLDTTMPRIVFMGQ